MFKITQEDLVRYLYNETSELKKAAIKAALLADWNLREAYENLLDSKKKLSKIDLSPRPEVVNKILEYAAKKQEEIHSH